MSSQSGNSNAFNLLDDADDDGDEDDDEEDEDKDEDEPLPPAPRCPRRPPPQEKTAPFSHTHTLCTSPQATCVTRRTNLGAAGGGVQMGAPSGHPHIKL